MREPMPAHQPPQAQPPLPESPELALARELTEQQFQLWRHQPISRLLFRFLADRQEALGRNMLERWMARSLKLVDEEEARGRALESEEVRSISLATIRNFYGIEGEQP